MAGFSTHLANAVINTTLRGQAMIGIGTPHFALFTSDPTDAFTAGTEVSDAWYARKPTGSFAAPSTGTTFNSTRVEFDPVQSAAITITHVGIVDGLTGGYLLYSEALATPKTLQVNDVFVIDSATLSGDFTLSLL